MTPRIHDEKLVEASLQLVNDGHIVSENAVEILREHIAGLTAELARIKQNQGCAREQRSTQFCAEAEAMAAELKEWKTLAAWGGTPAHVEAFIKGQQERIHAAQIECESLAEARKDSERVDWLEKYHVCAVAFTEGGDENELIRWWQVADDEKSLSGHPLATLRAAIDKAKEGGK